MYNKYESIEKKLLAATPEQIAEGLNRFNNMLERYEQEASDAIRFRPSYAPEGRETREESTTRIQLEEHRELVAHVEEFIVANDLMAA